MTSSVASRGVGDRHGALLEANLAWLQQALQLLGRIDAGLYTQSPRGLEPHRVGSHLRHIIEFYECFLDGVGRCRVDYDSRARDASIERSPVAAAARIRLLIERMKAPELLEDTILWVPMEDARGLSVEDPFLLSSTGRELQVLSSHTIHHFALIAMTLRAHGVPVDPDFGVAPSTLRHQAALGTAAGTEAA